MRVFILFGLTVGCRTEDSEKDPSVEEGTLIIDADNDGYSNEEDCDDTDASIYPGADEICDGIDNDCDGESDNGVLSIFYVDSDDDGFGSPEITTEACTAPDGYVANGSDCDDTQSSAFPGADEICDRVDNDCNDEIDEDLEGEFFVDSDGDGFGDSDQVIEGCQVEIGLSTIGGDCDDTDPAISPIANEICDEIDNDCNDEIDEGVKLTFYVDADADGYGDIDSPIEACEQPSNAVDNADDCDDISSEVNPDATEVCNDVDDDCDGVIDEDGSIGSPIWYTDSDSDGYGDINAPIASCEQPSNAVNNSDDCDDNNAVYNPSATESCNGVDDNCDGVIDEDGALGAIVYYADGDGDGQGDSAQTLESCNLTAPSGYSDTATDCDDNNSSVFFGATEICNNIDDDCDGGIDVNAVDELTYYIDSDSDGFGADSSQGSACTLPPSAVLLGGDCDDAEVTVSPVGIEVCDELDNDCDGSVDDSAVDAQTWYVDVDGDGFGESSSSIESCSQTQGYADNSDDCDDDDVNIYPGASEQGNNLDDNCDGTIDEGTPAFDSDGDGYSPLDGDCDDGDASLNLDDADGDGVSTCAGDCDDGDAALNLDDADGDGFTTCDGDCDDGDASFNLDDADSDGFTTCDGDCDDDDSVLNIDDSDGDGASTCDGDCDDGDATLNLDDADGDGFTTCAGDCDDGDGTLSLADADGDGFTTCAGDCDDSENTAYPNAVEECDGVDNNCDGIIDDTVLGQLESCPATSCKSILDNGDSVGDDLYWVDPDNGGAFEIYCNMTDQGGGWALFANHADNLTPSVNAPVLPDSYSVMDDNAWQRLRDSATTGMFFIDEHGNESILPISSFNNASCITLSSTNSLIGSGFHMLWHDETSGCTTSGSDYSLVALADSPYGASLYLQSGYGFSVWPYSVNWSYGFQDELLYFIQ